MSVVPRRTQVGIALPLAISLALFSTVSGISPASSWTGRAAPVVTQVALVNDTDVTTSTGRHLLMVLQASRSSLTGQTSMALILGLPNDMESHEWKFAIPATALKIAATGSGSVKVPTTRLHGYGRLVVSIAPSGAKKTTSCSGQPISATRRVTITGYLLWNTKSTGGHKWGSVGSATRKFPFSSSSSVVWSYQNTASCPAPPLRCTGGTSWSAGKAFAPGDSVSLVGYRVGRTYYVGAFRYVHLAHTAGKGIRSDSILATSKPFKLTSQSDGSASMKITAGARSAGSATIASTSSPTTSTSPCGTGSKQVQSRAWTASWKNGAHPLKVIGQVFGAISVDSESVGAYLYKRTVV